MIDSVWFLEILELNTVLYTGDANEPGFNILVRGFGGRDSAPAGRNRYAVVDNSGFQLGFDVPLGRTSRMGLFSTYTAMDVSNGSCGSWDTDGWCGGSYAEYWTETSTCVAWSAVMTVNTVGQLRANPYAVAAEVTPGLV